MTALVIDATELFRKRRSAQRAIRDAFEKNRQEHIERLIADEFTCAKCGSDIGLHEPECGTCALERDQQKAGQ